jgi:CheY-like chemotaxis protein
MTLRTGKAEKRILVVESEPDTRIFLSTLLKKGGFKPVLSRNGVEGFKKASEKAPDLIILDMAMPKDDALQMYRNLKKTAKLKEIPVVMLSEINRKTFFFFHQIPGSVAGQFLPEPEAFLEKPLESSELLRLIRALTMGAPAPQRRREFLDPNRLEKKVPRT